jgi:protein gp37
MADNSAIEWTEATWNPVVGCSILTPGCTNCYAMKMAARIIAMAGTSKTGLHYDKTIKDVKGKPVWTGKINLAPDHILLAPLKRKKPTTYFVNSTGDLFHEDCPDAWIDKVFAVMALAPQHTFQVLTKRAKRMLKWFAPYDRRRADSLGAKVLELGYSGPLELLPWPLPNVWLGVSTERQQEADERIPLLLQTPAAVRFISAEPLLGPIDLICTLCRFQDDPKRRCAVPLGRQLINWVIVGGESGREARGMHPAWARLLRDQCAAAGVPFFFKQWGEWAPSTEEHAAGNPRSGWMANKAHPHVAKAEELYPEAGAEFIAHVGKKAAGRLLDGELHNEFPTREISNGV